MPALDLGFSQFSTPQSPEFNELTINGNLPIPDYLNAEGFIPVDLNQEGISGLLYSNNALAYLAPEGNGNYAFPETPHIFPINHNFKNGENILTDIDGDGTLELVVEKEAESGFYTKQKDGKWNNFQPFDQYPTNVHFPVPEMAGLSHNGKTDLLVVEEDALLLYESKGKKGYHSPKRKQKVRDFPIIKKGYAKEFVGFLDVLGDGLPHRVRISNGSVECWPDLGYGNFAKKIVLGNAPVFGDDFDISRLFFADVDGSGTTDLVYAYPNRVELFLNENGNSFSDAITIHLPETYSKIDQISFADILGNGTTCIIFTKIKSNINGKPKHYYYDFVGEVKIDGQQQASLKPYLLNTITNNLGATTQIQYCSSTKFYLEDKKNGTPWITKLPFPVQVIEKVITSDKISGARYTQSFKYHDGFFDPVERTFRGFGYVESWDSEAYNAFDSGIARQNGSTITKADFVPPVYTKTWHHTGASFENKTVTAYYKQHFFQGDAEAYDFPDSVFDKDVFQQSPETLRQAYIALKGQVIRTEVYGEDSQEHPNLCQNPFTVTQSNQLVSLRQPIGEDNPYAIFLVTPRESINYHYERNPKDPRIEQQFTLETDTYGNVTSACQLFLPRRSNPTVHIPKEQQELSGTLAFNQYLKPPQDYLFCHQAYEKQHFQLFGIDLKGAQYFSYENINNNFSNIDVTTGKNVIPYSGDPTSGVQVQRLSWQQKLFWNNELTEALDLGKISLLGLFITINMLYLTNHFQSIFTMDASSMKPHILIKVIYRMSYTPKAGIFMMKPMDTGGTKDWFKTI